MSKSYILIIAFLIAHIYAYCANTTIKGSVFGNDGEAIIGATVIAKPCTSDSLTYGNATDHYGKYIIELPECNSAWVTVSYIGYDRYEKLYTNLSRGNEIDIILTRSSVKLDEVTVERESTVIKEDVLQFYPNKKQTQSSSNVTEMLDRLMVPGINVDRSSWNVTTATGEAVAILVDGREATPEELKTIRPKDVLRIEYVSRPAGRYSNRAAYVNYIMKKYEYGGYVYGSATQSFISNSGDYLVSAKLNHGKWTYQIDISDWLFNSEKEEYQTETLRFFDANNELCDLSRESSIANDRRINIINTKVSASYSDSTNYFYISANFKNQNLIKNDDAGNITYVPSNGLASRYTSKGNSITNLPSLTAKYEKKLPRNQVLNIEGSLGFSFGDSKYNYDETGDNPYSYIKNGEISNLDYRISGNYLLPLKNRDVLNFLLSAQGYKSTKKYFGTYPSQQDNFSHVASLGVYYMHRFNNQWRLNLGGYGTFNIYNTGIETRSEFMPSGMATLTYNINRNNIINAYFSSIIISDNSYRNNIIQPIDRIMYNMGNHDIENGYQIMSQISYTGVFGKFSIMPYLQHSNSNNILPYTWLPGEGAIYQTKTNNGTYNQTFFGVAPKINLFNNKLSISGAFNVSLQHKSKLYHRTRHPYSGKLSAYLYIGNFSFYASYLMSSGKRMTSYGTYDSKGYDDWWFDVTYSNANLSLKVGVRNLFEKKYNQSWVNAPYYTSYSRYTMTDFSQRVYVTLTYTIDFGHKVQRTQPSTSNRFIDTEMM